MKKKQKRKTLKMVLVDETLARVMALVVVRKSVTRRLGGKRAI